MSLVSCREIYSNPFRYPYCITCNSNDTYIKTKETIYICGGESDFWLRTHEFSFTINNTTLQEVVGHKERVGGSDEVLSNVIYSILLFQNY